MVNNDIVRKVANDLRAMAGSARMVYAGSDLDPVDYAEVRTHPDTLRTLASKLEEFLGDSCSLCKMWTTEYNVALANGKLLSAKVIQNRLEAHERSKHA